MTYALQIDGGVLGLHTAVKAIFEIRRASGIGNFVIIPEYTEIEVDLVLGEGEVFLTPNTVGSIYQCKFVREDDVTVGQFFFEMPSTNVFLSALNRYTAWPYAIDEGTGVSKFIDLEDVVEGEPNFGLNKFLTEFAPEDGERRFGFSAVTVDLVSGLTDALAGKAATNHTHQINHVDGLESALNGLEPTITATTAADYYRGDKTFQPLNKTAVGLANVDNTSDLDKPISNLTQTALDTKEPTLAATTSADYYRGDKTFQPLNKAAVGLSSVDNTSDLAKPLSTSAITALAGKLSEVVTPSVAAGEALTMVKSGTNGQLKKLIAGQDTTLSSTADTVTIGTTGRTLKDFVEVSETVNSKLYRYFVPNISPTGTAATNIRLVGRQGTAGSNYSFSLIDATSNLKPNTGAGSVDLQIVRDAVGQTASGADNYVAGKRITVQGRNCIVLDATNTTKSVSGNNNVVIGLKHITDGSSGTSTVSGGENTAINVLTIFGAVTGNQNTLIGSGGGSGNNNTALGVGAGGSTGNGGLTLCHSTGNPIGGNRGMSGALTRGTANNLVNHQIIEMYYTATTSAYTSGTWSNLTWDGLVAGTTNVYSAPSVSTVVISGYVRVGSTTNGRLFKVEAILMHGSLSQTITFVAGDADPAYGSVQLVKSGNYIYVQIKQDGDLTILGKATLSFTEF